MRLAWGLFTGAVGVAWSFLPGSPALAQGDTSPSLLAPVAAGGETATRTASAVNTGRSRCVQAHAGLLTGLDPGRGTRVHLPLFDDATFDVVVDRTAVMGVGTQAWYGRLVGVPLGTVTMVVHQGLFAAAIHAGGRGTFDVLPRPDGTGVVRELVADDLPSCGGALTDGAAPSAARSADAAADKPQAGSGGVETSFVPSLPVCDDGTVIDLLVVYTQDALAAAGDVATMNARINLAVADTNDAFVRSLINTSVRLVHTQQVLYTESGDADIDAPRLVNPSDGYLDDVHPLRDQYGADCVSLWVKTFNAGGIGYFPHPSWTGVGASGFTIVRQDTAGGLVLAHELGHNLWCAHDRANAPDPPFAEYSYGYREPGGAWHDIMAYPPGFLIPYFANPDVNYPGPINPGPTGVPVGDPLPCDIALTINETRTFVANFRSTFVAGLPAVLHVRSSAPSGGDGLSWATAFNDIQRALCRAGGSNGAVQEIWVSQGTYRPDAGTGRRDVGFILANGIALYGGFVGTEISRDQRDLAAHVTTLSGDIGTAGVATDNSYHVVVGSGTDATAVLDGFTITGGYVDTADFPGNTGGGLLVENGAPTIANCVFVGNYAGQGGGAVGNHQASPTLTNCTFDSNSGGEYAGGAVLNYSLCNPTITGCTFQSNSAVFAGAILNAFTSSPTITGCTFDQNSTTGVNRNGGAIYNYTNSSPAIGSCTFTANQADYGAAIGNAFDCSPAITNCVFRANVAAGGGAGVDTYSNCNVALTNCLFSGNVADFGAAVTMFASSNINFGNCTIVGNQAGFAAGLYGDSSAPTLANCILWANNDVNGTIEWSQIYMASGTPTLQYCTVQSWTGGLGGTANNGTNPQFVDADGPDNVYGTADDNPRLQAASPCVNTGNNAALPGGTTTDLDGGPRILSGTVDRGAYEYVPAIPGDSDHDGDVDDADLAAFINCGTGPSIGPPAPDCAWADLDGDNDVDSADFARFQRCISGADGAGDPNCAGL